MVPLLILAGCSTADVATEDPASAGVAAPVAPADEGTNADGSSADATASVPHADEAPTGDDIEDAVGEDAADDGGVAEAAGGDAVAMADADPEVLRVEGGGEDGVADGSANGAADPTVADPAVADDTVAPGIEAAVATAPVGGPVTYTLSPSKSRLYVIVRYQRGGIGGALGHDHVIVANQWSGTARWDPEDASACDIRIDVPVTGLAVDPGSSRSWAGFEGSTSDGDKESITDNFRGRKQLDLANHSAISFRSSSCTASGSVSGNLGIRGATKAITVPMSIDVSDGTLDASGRFQANHTDFGFSPFKALGGVLKNQDLLEFVIDIEGVE